MATTATTTHSSNTGTSSTGGISVETQRSTISRRLPTRMSKTMPTTSTITDCDETNAGIESRQDSQVNDTFDRRDGSTSDDAVAGTGTATIGKCVGEEDERVQTPKEEKLGASLEPAFVLKDMDTIDHPQYNNLHASSPHHQSSSLQRHHMRSPSPGHGSVISRRGRSRSPVGLTPHHHRTGSNSRAPSAVTVQVGVGGQGELSSAALAAGEAAASNLAAGYHQHHHHSSTSHDNNTAMHHFPASPQRIGRRSPSPVSRFPSLTSQSFEISPQHSMKTEGFMGSFDWNVGPTLQHHQQQRQYSSGDSMVTGAQTKSHQRSSADRQYHDPYSNGVGDEQYYSNYPPSYPYCQPNENNSKRSSMNNNTHPRHPPQQTTQGRSPSPTYRNEVVDHDRQHRRHHQVNHFHDRSYRHAQSNDPATGAGRHLPRRSSQQALFPEHHILSSHSKDRNDVRTPRHAVPSPSSSPTSDRGEGSIKSSKRGGSRDSGKSNNTETHRSSVFRGSLAERGAGPRQRNAGGSLPQELLLALEEDEDNEDATHPNTLAENDTAINPNSENSAFGGEITKDRSKDARSTASPINPLVASPSVLGFADPMQIDNCLMQESMNLNDYDDYLTGNLSFRKSYDLGQVFSFIKDGGGGGTHGQLSFTLGLSSESNEEVDHDRAKLNNGGNDHGCKGSRALYGSQSMGLTPINSFSCDNNRQGNNGGIIPLNSMDGMALRAFFSSSPTTIGSPLLGESSSPSLIKIGSPQMNGDAYNSSQSETAPVVHASTPPSYSHHGPDMQYGPPQVGSHGMISHCTYSNMETPPHGPSSGSYHNSRGTPQSNMQPGSGRGTITMSFPTKRIKLSTKHSVHPTAMDLSRRLGGDDFVLLRKLAPCFANFRFKLPELESSDPEVARNGNSLGLRNPSGLHQAHMTIAKRRISSSICAFGGSLPPRTVSPSPSSESLSNPDSPNKIHGALHNTNKASYTCHEDSPRDREERLNYEQSLSGRYFMKETCISWDVELHEVITPQVGDGRRGQKKAGISGKSITMTSDKRQIGVFRKGSSQQMSPNYCAPVTPSSPSDYHDDRIHVSVMTPGGLSLGGDDLNSPHPQSSQEKGTKVKYRCKLCGQPKQNHTCSYQSAMVRSIGTMVYPAVNAFVSNEPGRLAPALSEMNNFTSLLSQDTSTIGGSQLGNMHSFGGPFRPPLPQSTHRRGPGNLYNPDASHWSPNTPGGLSTMSSRDPNSPGVSAVGPPAGLASNMMNASHHCGIRKHDHNQTLMSRSLNYSMSMSHSGPSPSSVLHMPSMPPAPAGAIPSDVLFRDTMELKREQFRTVGATSATASTNGNCGGDINAIIYSPNAFRYPPIPTPYSQRKELGDTLFAMSREVPSLADSCAAILREARENDEWDQAVAELTTQVLVVIKCEEQDYTLEGLRRHLMTLGIAC